ncbi:unnamed protein product [Trichobilharzia szidati]|nr:unnamed protein product [Trichobilharzia szidati]
MASKAERRRQRLRFQQSSHCKNSFSVRRRLVGPAFRAALKSACMRPVNSGGVSSVENTSFSLNSDQIPLNNSGLISAPGSHVQESGFHRKNNLHSDSLDPIKSVDENFMSLDHQSSDSSYERTFDTAVNLPPNVITKLEEDSINIQNMGSGFSSTILKNNPCLLQEVPVDSKTHVGIHDRMIRSTNSTNSHLFYDAAETSLSDREKLNLTPRSSSIDTQITEDIGVPGWSTLTPGTREKRRHPRRQDLTNDDLVKLEDSSICGLNISPEDAFDDHVYEFDVHPKAENTTDNPDDDEDCKRYCICRDVSYGDMIACDAPDCPFEWFHYACVNLTVAPKGRWFCPTCSKSIANKKNPKKSSSRK